MEMMISIFVANDTLICKHTNDYFRGFAWFTPRVNSVWKVTFLESKFKFVG
jgi:hypothetical protein